MKINDLYPKLNDNLFQGLLNFYRRYSDIYPQIIEKDLFVTGMLKRIVENHPQRDKMYFKGGTALAKCHRITKRFSEDCDFFIYSGDNTASRTHEQRLNSQVKNNLLALFPGDRVDVDEKGEKIGREIGDFNQLFFSYDFHADDKMLKPFVEFELSSSRLKDKEGFEVISVEKEMEPIVATILRKNGRNDIVESLGLFPFNIQCESPERTVCDKISRMVRISLSDKFRSELARYIRDAYDLAMFMRYREYREYLKSSVFLRTLYIIYAEDKIRGRSHVFKPYSDACVFKSPEECFSIKSIKSAYSQIIECFVLERHGAPSLDEVIETYRLIHQGLELFDEYRATKVQCVSVQENSEADDVDKKNLRSLGIPEEDITDIYAGKEVSTDSYFCCGKEGYDRAAPPFGDRVLFFRLIEGRVMVRNRLGEYMPLRKAMRASGLDNFANNEITRPETLAEGRDKGRGLK